MPGADQGGGTITVNSETIRYTGKSAATGAANLTEELFVDLMVPLRLLIQVEMQSLNMPLEWIIF